MRNYGLFILAFAVIAAALIKSQKAGPKKVLAKKQNVTLTQWAGSIKKEAVKIIPVAQNQIKNYAISGGKQAAGTVSKNRRQSRSLASIAPSAKAATAASSAATGVGRVSDNAFKPRDFAARSNFYGNAGPYLAATGKPPALRQASFSSTSDPVQELSSFTRTPDLSINTGVDPELGETFEDQIRKFRDQNQLTSQELQELEVITNNFVSMSNSVQRGQVPMPQVNAEAIKITRSFLNLKRRIEARAP